MYRPVTTHVKIWRDSIDKISSWLAKMPGIMEEHSVAKQVGLLLHRSVGPWLERLHAYTMADVQSDLKQDAITGPNNFFEPFGHLHLFEPSSSCVQQLTSWSDAVLKLHKPYWHVLSVYVYSLAQSIMINSRSRVVAKRPLK